MIVYVGTGGTASVAVTGLLYGNPKLLGLQALALGFIIVYDAVATFVVIKLVSFFVPLRMTDKELEIGDLELHGEVAIDMSPDESVIGAGSYDDRVPVSAGEPS
jgi:Amt family ammonium transporter